MTTSHGTTTTAPVRTPAPTVWPTFQADDAPAMIDFLVDVVGFRRNAVHIEGELASHTELDWPEGGGVMMGSRRDTSGVAPGIASIDVVTDHVDEVHAACSPLPASRSPGR